jgi:hypothetical protein
MRRTAARHSNPAINSVQRRFESWRKHRKRSEPIPEELWAAAVKLTEEHTLAQVSRALCLDHKNLKKRVSRSQSTEPGRTGERPRFVEVSFPEPALCSGEYHLEIEGTHGERLTLNVKGETKVDIMEVLRAFWGRR